MSVSSILAGTPVGISVPGGVTAGGAIVARGGVESYTGLAVLNSANEPVVAAFPLDSNPLGPPIRGGLDIYGGVLDTDVASTARMRLRGYINNTLDIARLDLSGDTWFGPYPYIRSWPFSDPTKPGFVEIGYNLEGNVTTGYGKVNIIGAAGAGQVYDAVNNKPVMAELFDQSVTIGGGAFATAAPVAFGATYTSDVSGQVMFEVGLGVDLTVAAGATVNNGDCIGVQLYNNTDAASVTVVYLRPFSAPNTAGGGVDYSVRTTVAVPLLGGKEYQFRWFPISPAGNLLLGGATTAIGATLIGLP